ncbi:MAG TPA: TIGR03435 family protein [Candidatus Acidoferrales bacterium]
MPLPRLSGKFDFGRKVLLAVIGLASVAGFLVFAIAAAVPLHAQSATTGWEKAAGGKMSFEVASVKEDSGPKTQITNAGLHPPVRPFSNFPLNNSDGYSPNGGLLSATNWPLVVYIGFAYKLTPVETGSVMSHLPKWSNEERFDIQARAAGNVSKDQMRLMMQSLLADRFKLAIHEETQEEPVYELMLEKPGKLGPQIIMRPAGTACSGAAPITIPDSVPAALAKRITLPIGCGTAPRSLPTEEAGAVSWAVGRDFTAAQLAGLLSVSDMTNRPVIDKTGITGRFDFVLYWQLAGSVDAEPELSAPPFIDALKNQLGLKLVPSTGPVETFVVDHIEQPTPN